MPRPPWRSRECRTRSARLHKLAGAAPTVAVAAAVVATAAAITTVVPVARRLAAAPCRRTHHLAATPAPTSPQSPPPHKRRTPAPCPSSLVPSAVDPLRFFSPCLVVAPCPQYLARLPQMIQRSKLPGKYLDQHSFQKKQWYLHYWLLVSSKSKSPSAFVRPRDGDG